VSFSDFWPVKQDKIFVGQISSLLSDIVLSDSPVGKIYAQCIFDNMALYFERRIYKNALLQTVFLGDFAHLEGIDQMTRRVSAFKMQEFHFADLN